MKRNALPARKAPAPWSDLGYAALQGKLADTFDDRVSESIFDGEDEREAVDVVVQGMRRILN
jgi:hypothetical protein